MRETIEIVRAGLRRREDRLPRRRSTSRCPAARAADAARDRPGARADLHRVAVAADVAADRRSSPTAGSGPASSRRVPRRTSIRCARAPQRPDATFADLDVCQGAEVAFAADEDELRAHGRGTQEGTRVQPRRDGFGVDELLQRRVQPAGLGRRSPPRCAACGRPAVVMTQRRWSPTRWCSRRR